MNAGNRTIKKNPDILSLACCLLQAHGGWVSCYFHLPLLQPTTQYDDIMYLTIVATSMRH